MTLDELWTHLGGFAQILAAPLVVDYFYFTMLHYVIQHLNGRISLTDTGTQPCDEPDYQPPST
ncbi:MAG: hypothetical protein WCF23_18055 [Candidatus Nitrosopolaris sp.]